MEDIPWMVNDYFASVGLRVVKTICGYYNLVKVQTSLLMNEDSESLIPVRQ